jgi:hypothetical protein
MHGIFEVSSVHITMTEEVKIFANKENVIFSKEEKAASLVLRWFFIIDGALRVNRGRYISTY